MQSHAESDGSHEERVFPDWQYKQARILRQRIHGVEHLDGDENGQTHSCSPMRIDVREHLASNLGEQSRTFVEVGLHMSVRFLVAFMILNDVPIDRKIFEVHQRRR